MLSSYVLDQAGIYRDGRPADPSAEPLARHISGSFAGRKTAWKIF